MIVRFSIVEMTSPILRYHGLINGADITKADFALLQPDVTSLDSGLHATRCQSPDVRSKTEHSNWKIVFGGAGVSELCKRASLPELYT